MLRCGKLVEQLDAIDCAYIEVGKYLGLPTQAYIGMSDSKTLDAQTGFARVPCNRITYVGELGYELWIPSEQAVHVYDRVVKACCGSHPAEIKNSPFGGLCCPANRENAGVFDSRTLCRAWQLALRQHSRASILPEHGHPNREPATSGRTELGIDFAVAWRRHLAKPADCSSVCTPS